MYEVAATWCRPSVSRIIAESIEQIAYGVLRTEGSFRSSKFSIAVARVDDRRLLRPVITLHPRADSPLVTLTAEEAELRSDRKAGGLVIVCRNWEVEVEGEKEPTRLSDPETQHYTVPFESPKRPVHRDWLASKEIPDCIAELEKQIDEAKQKLASDDEKKTSYLNRRIADLQWRVHRLASEPYRRWSNGFSCLCFVLIGAPVAMRWRFDSYLSSFFICFLPILGIYYPLLMIQEDLATSGVLPPIAFWLGNIVLLGPAVWLLRQVIRY
jgi:lipopolysaccharide export system permease protein